MVRPRQKLVATITVFATLTLLLLAYREDLREVPDRWHAPFLNPEPASSLRSPLDIFNTEPGLPSGPHPIDDLVSEENSDFEGLLNKQTYNVSASAAAYRERRGRHPPPGFDRWMEFAVAHDCVVIEEFFDQVYRDIEPFWGLPASEIRDQAATLPNTISVRNGKVTKSTDEWRFVDAYFDMLKEIEDRLPDVDIPINEMDESRVLVPWEDINELISCSEKTKDLSKLPSVTAFSNLNDPSETLNSQEWLHEGPYWNIARNGCHSDSPGRSADIDTDFSTPPQANITINHYEAPANVQWAKLPFNNDILLPGAVYWRDEKRFSINSGRIPWAQKRSEVLWRGSASGGRNTEINWTRFQRHRLLSMLNGTQVQMALEAEHAAIHGEHDALLTSPRPSIPHNFPLPDRDLYPLQSLAQGLLPDWLRTLSNAAFTWLVCFPPTKNYECSYTGPWYRRGAEMPLHRMFHAKYLPDVDGNSFSGRYRAFLQSNSLPIKATIYSEWHDDRLFAWRHFVPMDNTFVDLWALLEYLVSHDAVAEGIALEGRKWAERVLRKEDMLVYVYRLVLEYARVSSDAREDMGWLEERKSVS
ncbi:hypothetical protein PMZ80_004576 [Knufia obscura]|uniref:Glycosyl transferase CAP10 domain-containing protein n=1 Tax=Knufia obscura TaxID=1635080 RepID=A0ABR0RTG0_9EURO|nr:hypothetical protein PMZ80_004576 [Knufia obscura]